MQHDDDILRAAGTRVIVFTGAAGAGKSTAREAIMHASAWPSIWQHVSFAEPLKAMLRALLDYACGDPATIHRMMAGDLKNESTSILNGRSPRYAMQTLGTEWGRDLIHPDIWIDIARQRITAARQKGYNVIVDDCRFQNEADMLYAIGARFIHIQGRGGIGTDHPSERGVANCDAVIANTGSIADFMEAVRREVLTA